MLLFKEFTLPPIHSQVRRVFNQTIQMPVHRISPEDYLFVCFLNRTAIELPPSIIPTIHIAQE